MDWRRGLLFGFVVLPGLAAVVVSGYYLFQDWSALISAFGRFEKAAAAGADLRSLYVAGALDHVYRLNAFADGVGVMLGAVLFGIGIHGLCTLPPAPGAKPAQRFVPVLGGLLACVVVGAVLVSLMRRVGLTNDLRRAVIRHDVAKVRELIRSGADPHDRLWWGRSAIDAARDDPELRAAELPAILQAGDRKH